MVSNTRVNTTSSGDIRSPLEMAEMVAALTEVVFDQRCGDQMSSTNTTSYLGRGSTLAGMKRKQDNEEDSVMQFASDCQVSQRIYRGGSSSSSVVKSSDVETATIAAAAAKLNFPENVRTVPPLISTSQSTVLATAPVPSQSSSFFVQEVSRGDYLDEPQLIGRCYSYQPSSVSPSVTSYPILYTGGRIIHFVPQGNNQRGEADGPDFPAAP